MTVTAEPALLDAHALRSRLEGGRPPGARRAHPAEFETSHIPGSYNVPLPTLQEHRDELRRHLDEDVVLVCRSGGRARQAEQALAGAGLPGLRVLDGGMNAWEGAGGEVNRGRSTWELERQVRLTAGSLVLASVLASTALPRAKWVAAAIGGGLSAAALSNTCAMGMVLSRMPWNRGSDASYDIDEVVRALTS